MTNRGQERPDVLVLGGGGVLGEAWLSAVLGGIEQAGGFDARDCSRFLGTSAGSIVAATLAAGMSPSERLELAGRPAQETPSAGRGRRNPLEATLAAAGELAAPAAASLASLTLNSTAFGGALLRRALLSRVPSGTRSHAELARLVERSGISFDGRLLIAAVEVSTGRRVLFGSPGAPPCSVAQAVSASCAIPGVFAAVSIAGREYVDGGAWSPTNMDALEVSRGETLLCLNPTASLRPARGTLAGVFGPVSRTISAGEALALRHRGVRVRTINPDAGCVRAMGVDLMNPSRRPAVIAAGYAQGLRLGSDTARRAA